MKCIWDNCKREVEHPERKEWNGLCDKHVEEITKDIDFGGPEDAMDYLRQKDL